MQRLLPDNLKRLEDELSSIPKEGRRDYICQFCEEYRDVLLNPLNFSATMEYFIELLQDYRCEFIKEMNASYELAMNG